MRETEVQVKVKVPEATEVKKLEKKSLISYIYVGRPVAHLARMYGTEPLIQLNDKLVNEEGIPYESIQDFVLFEREKLPESDKSKLTMSLRIDENITGAVGIQLGHRNMAGESFEGGDNLLDPNSTDYVAGFIFEELQATKYLRLQAAARYEQNEVEGTGLDIATGDPVRGNPSFRPVSGSIGALYDIGFAVTARASAQYVERAPDAAELYSHGHARGDGDLRDRQPDPQQGGGEDRRAGA